MKRPLAEIAIYSAAALVLLATVASATPWSVPDGEGGWEPNPECSSANCHETGNPDPEPEPPTPPEPPKGGEKPSIPFRGENGRSVSPAYFSCCVLDGQRYVLPRTFMKRRAISECAALRSPPTCTPLSPANPYTGTYK